MTSVSQRNGLTFEEYLELRHLPGDEDPRSPLSTEVAARQLHSRGYAARSYTLNLLIEFEELKLAEPDVWTPADIEFAASHFENCELYAPYTEMCITLGCRYVDFLRALREAAERESRKYGRHVPADDQYFVMHRFPPHMVEDSSDNLADIKPAIITFTLSDDVRERLERGEEV